MSPLVAALSVLAAIGFVVALIVALLVARRSRVLRRRQRSVLSATSAMRTRGSFTPSVGGLLAPLLAGPRWRGVSLSFGLGASSGYVLGGAVAAVVLGAYGVVAVLFVRGRRGAVARRAARSAQLDRLTGLAADLRAGIPVQAASNSAVLGADMPIPTTMDPAPPVAGIPGRAAIDAAAFVGVSRSTAGRGRVMGSAREDLDALAGAAVTLAERTGAPLADLIDRIEADARAGDRARAAAVAQSAGAQATALLLAALPVGGLALGYAIGADPLAILLHTPLGAVCALGAVGLQILGLAWSQRLAPRAS